MQEVELVVKQPGEPERRVVLAAGVTQIGRAEDNDLVLPDIGVSRRHARILVEASRVFIEDMGSGNGTFARGDRVDRMEVEDGDEVVIDPFVLQFHLRSAASPNARPVAPAGGSAYGASPSAQARLVVLAGQRLAPSYDLGPELFTIGRSEGRDVILFDPASSRTHTQVEWRAGTWWVVDLGSANGTFVNARRAREEPLTNGDIIRIGSTEFRFELGAAGEALPPVGPVPDRPEPEFDPPRTPPASFSNPPRFEAIPAHNIEEVQGRPTTVDFGQPRQVAVASRPAPAAPAPVKKKGGAGKMVAIVAVVGLLLLLGLALVVALGGAAWFYFGVGLPPVHVLSL